MIPLLLCQVLYKRVQTFVHPRPLALVRVNNHWEEVVTYLVDNHTNHSILRALAVRAVCFWTTAVETNLRVLHTDPFGVYRNGFVVRVIYCEFAVHLQSVRNNTR